MLSNVKIELHIVLRGGAAIMEHPSQHSEADYASVWRTSLQRVLCGRAPGFHLLHFQQWRFGADAIKPTTLRVMGLPHSAKTFHAEAYSNVTKPCATLEGIDPLTGLFKTARAKEYPSGLCRALVITLLKGLAERRRRCGVQCLDFSLLKERDANWLRTVAAASQHCTAATFMPDYQPVR